MRLRRRNSVVGPEVGPSSRPPRLTLKEKRVRLVKRISRRK